jgi:predicted ATPase
MEVEPAPATTSLYEQIRTDNFPEQAQPAAAVSNQLHHLPRPLTPLIGRDNELDQLVRHLGDPACRLLTLTGPGGIGKTRLCIEAARHLADNSDRFNDGIFYLSLGQIERGSLLVSSLVQALKISIRTNIDMRQNLLNYLRNKQILLVLDNFEHLLGQSEGESSPAAISLLVETLTEFSGVSYFVTSRQPLALDGEWLFPIGGLTYTTTNGLGADNPLEQPAPQLFLESGRRYRPSLDAADESAAILEICRLTDGMPLALEIAAAWLRVLDSREIAERISQNLDFLTSPHRDIPDRQRSIRAIFASTWEYLSAEQQYGLAAMSVFRSPFTAQAAIKVAQASVLDLAVLVEKSLLRRTGENQYTLHELVRQFAAEKLNEMDGETAVKARHAAFYFSFLDDKLPDFDGPDPEESLHLRRQVIDDVRAAGLWAVTERELDR